MKTSAKWALGVFGAFGAYLLAFGIYFIYEAVASTHWDSVEGTITNTKIVSRSSRSGNSGSYTTEYAVQLKYKYEVNGKSYNGSRFSLGSGNTVEGGFNEREDAKKWLAESEYKIGKKLTVYVKPGDPEETVLSSGLNWGTFVPSIMGLLFLILIFFIPKLQKLAENNRQS